MNNEYRILYKKVGKEPVVATVENTLEAKQKLVGGLIEIVSLDENTLLVILDTHKKALTMNPDLVDIFSRKLIIDHHVIGEELIENTLLRYIRKHRSSTSEILVDLLDYYDVSVDPYIATIMLAGTQIDTNNFNIKTTEKTFLTASKLVHYGADTKEVGYLLKQDLYAYLKRQKIIENADIIKGKYAIGVGSIRHIYDKEEIAKASDSLLLFDGIEASFTIGKIEDSVVGVSARSIGNVDVQKIMEAMGGGGHATEAACQIEGRSIESVREELIKQIRNIIGR